MDQFYGPFPYVVQLLVFGSLNCLIEFHLSGVSSR